MKTDTETWSAAEWIARLGDTQELTPAEKAAFMDFLRASPTHIKEVIEQSFVKEDLRTLQIPEQKLQQWIEEARASVAEVAQLPLPRAGHAVIASEQEREQKPWRGPGWRWLVAASLAAALAFGAFFYSRMGLYTTEFGEQRILMLADGSVVSLNTESRMKVTYSGDKRSIDLLKGEAFFNVAHDAKRPFFVNVDNVVLRAVGTQFNVKMAHQDTVVSMVDGAVKLTLAEAAPLPFKEPAAAAGPLSGILRLSKGEEARIARGDAAHTIRPISKTATNTALRAAAWTRGRLEFDGAPLTEVLSEFQRYRRLQFQIEDESTRQLKLTGSFEFHDPESVLAYIGALPGMKVEKTGPYSYLIHRG